jgi:hypothetical protein
MDCGKQRIERVRPRRLVLLLQKILKNSLTHSTHGFL